jgi:hypothetical protein
MKKLITLLLLFTITLFYNIPTQAALTPPALFDYSFVYDATDGEFQFKDGTNSYTPEFTRTADGIYFNYEYIGDGDGLLPFELTLRFNRPNTSWTLGTSGYIATDTNIGSDNTVGSINKFEHYFNNNTNNDYKFLLDVSNTTTSASNTNYVSELFYNNFKFNTYSSFIRSSPGSLIEYFIPTGYISHVRKPLTSVEDYFDAFYLIDLGISPAVQSTTAYETGYETGYEVGYGDGYTDAVEEDNAYALGFAKGLLEGGDMETGSSLLILIVALIGFVMMIFGFTTKRGIFNLLSVGAFVVLGTLLVQFVGFVIIAIGLVLINIYYAFFGDL